MNVLLEICIDSIESANAAKEGGADRLEVCGPLAVGGTTPSLSLVERCVERVQLPVMMMIRPHDGGFVYQPGDIELMLADIKIAHSIGVQGVVLGALTKDRRVDVETCRRLKDAAAPLETTFHRAFDIVEEPVKAFDQTIEMGFDRLLTSGQAATAQEGVALIHSLNDRAGDRITLIVGGGINEQNARTIVEATGVQELHASASASTDGQSKNDVVFGAGRRVTTADRVRAIKRALN